MLVLSRKAGERLTIGSEIVVTVLEIRGDSVRLGCQAPADLPIHRFEVPGSQIAPSAEPPPPRKPESPFFVECA